MNTTHLERECRSYARYLIGQAPSAYIIEKYLDLHAGSLRHGALIGSGGPLMDPIVVVGSGASGVHFALSVLRKGRRVTMLDVGHTGREAVRPGDTLNGLKQNLPHPIDYFLGSR